MRHYIARKRLSCTRRASIFICVLVCLAVATGLVVQTLYSALRARDQMHGQRDLQQTELLLEAGVLRAAQRLRADEQYLGETWKLSPKSLPGYESASIAIDVSSLDGEWPRRVHVAARLSAGGPNYIQRSQTFTLNTINDLGLFDKE